MVAPASPRKRLDRPPLQPTEDFLDRRHPDERPRIDVPRVLLVGLVGGGIWTVLSIGLLSLVGGHLLASVPGSRVGGDGGSVGPVLIVLNVGIGIWGTWLYAALRPALGPGPRPALVAGLAWWAIVTLQTSKWVVAVVDPWTAAIPTAAVTLPAALATTLAVARIYERRAEDRGRPT